jgi:hypothetical protein
MIFVISCKKSESINKVEIRLPEAQSLKLERKIVDVNLYRPFRMFIHQHKMIVYDKMKDSLFKVFDAQDLTYRYTFGSIGAGPDEFTFVSETTMNSSDYFEILDQHELCYYAVTDSAAFQVSSPKIVIHKSGPVNNLKKISDSIYIFSNNISDDTFEKEFILYNINDRTDREFGDLMFFEDEDGMKSQSIETQYFSLSKLITANSKNNKFAAFYFGYPYFKIFSSNILSGVYHVNDEIQHEENCVYFSGLYSTDKYIYTFWIAMPEEKIEADMENFKPNLLIFDWDGNIVKNYKCNIPIVRFAVNDSNDKLYAVSANEDDINAIYVCDLDI